MQDYSEEEIEYLTDRIGTIPIAVLCSLFCRKFSRTKGAVRLKIYRLMRSEKLATYLEDYFSISEIAKLLKVEPHQVKCWVLYQGLKFKKISERRTCVRRKDLRDLAITKPHLFRQVERSALDWLVEDTDLVESIKNTPVSRVRGKRRKVLRISDYKVFESISEAAIEAFTDPSSLSKKINKGLPCSGTIWKFLD